MPPSRGEAHSVWGAPQVDTLLSRLNSLEPWSHARAQGWEGCLVVEGTSPLPGRSVQGSQQHSLSLVSA